MIGSYLYPPTWLHRVPAIVKLLLLLVSASFFLAVARWDLIVIAIVVALAAFASLGRRAIARLRNFSPLLPLLLFIYIAQWYVAGREAAAVSIGQLLLMVLLADLVTMTTTMQAMLEVLEPLFAPLARFGLSSRKIALAVALVVRFVPVLFELWARRSEAWRARTSRRPPLKLIGLFVADTLRMADNVAEALDARGFAAGRSARPK